MDVPGDVDADASSWLQVFETKISSQEFSAAFTDDDEFVAKCMVSHFIFVICTKYQ